MTLNEYQKLAMRTSPEGHDRVKNGCMGLIGESGELMDVLKKHLFQSGEHPPFPTDRVIDECGDVLWYCAELACGLGIPLQLTVRYYSPPHKYFENQPAESVAAHLSFVAATIYRLQNFDDVSVDGPDAMPGWMITTTIKRIAMVMGLVEVILRRCASNRDMAMEQNIQKLRARYPEGFDPDRSLHRERGQIPREEA